MPPNNKSTIFRSPYILPIDTPPIRDGAIKIKKNKIVAISKFGDLAKARKDRLIYLDDCIIVPGFVNSHTHLELSCLKGVIKERKSFSKWIIEVIEAKKKLSEKDYEKSIKNGILESIKGGITCFGDISGTGLSPKIMKKLGVRGISFHEVIGFKEKEAWDIFYTFIMKIAISQILYSGKEEILSIGISPHSPYSVSHKLFKLSCNLAKRLNLPVSTHLSETEDEVRFLKNGNGPLRKLLLDLGSFENSWKPPACSPLKYLDSLNVLNPNISIVHFNFFDKADLGIAKKSNIKVIFCPKSNNEWFSRKSSPLIVCLEKSIPISIGTDSLASNNAYNMFDEMRMVKSLYPSLPAKKILQMATIGGAFCLRLKNKIGSLRPGKLADFIAIKIPEKIKSKDLPEYIVSEAKEVSLSVINGRAVYNPLRIL